LDPVDYLSPSLVRDDILGIRIPGHSGGHDEWGFRNKQVPRSADIVTLGDSHTYGNTAKMAESWPLVLGRLTGKSVYNLGMGGYGPNQYYYLLKTKAVGLNPQIIICGLYMGDDFDNAIKISYGLDYWHFLRDPKYLEIRDAWDIWEQPSPNNWHKKARIWLSSHSLLYKLVVHGLMGRLKGSYQMQHASELYGPTPTLLIKEKNLWEAFQPRSILIGLDQEEKSVKEGMRISFQLIHDMNEICRSKNIAFVVVVIPTKESVFSNYIEKNTNLALSDVIDNVILNERKAREKLFTFFKEANIQYIDTLAQLRQAIDHEKLYAYHAVDMHPNRNGYKIIAKAIAEFIKQGSPPTH
jgi:hypothetical protein